MRDYAGPRGFLSTLLVTAARVGRRRAVIAVDVELGLPAAVVAAVIGQSDIAADNRTFCRIPFEKADIAEYRLSRRGAAEARSTQSS